MEQPSPSKPMGSFIVGGKNPANDRWVLTAELQATGLNAIRIEALVDKSMKRNGPGRAVTVILP